MQEKRNLPDQDVKRVIERILETRRITKADQQRFMGAMLSRDRLNEAERLQVDLIFDNLRTGRLKVVD